MNIRIPAVGVISGVLTSVYSVVKLGSLKHDTNQFILKQIDRDYSSVRDKVSDIKNEALFYFEESKNDPKFKEEFKKNIVKTQFTDQFNDLADSIKDSSHYDQIKQDYYINSLNFYATSLLVGLGVTAISVIAIMAIKCCCSKKEQESTPAEQTVYTPAPRPRRRTPVFENDTLNGSPASSSSSSTNSSDNKAKTTQPVIDEEAEKQKELEIQKLEAAAKQKEIDKQKKEAEENARIIAEEIARQQAQVRERIFNESKLAADNASTKKKFKPKKI